MPPRKRTAGGPTLTLMPALKNPHADAPDLRDAVATRLAAMKLTDADQPLAALAQRYAKEVEHAAEQVAEAERLLERAAEEGDYFLGMEVRRLRRRIELSEIVAKVGPLLHRALADLAPPPAARAKGAGAVSPTAAGRLQQLRGGSEVG